MVLFQKKIYKPIYMDGSYISLLLFIIVTIFYFVVLKGPQLTVQILQNGNSYSSYKISILYSLFSYFVIVVFTQFGANVASIMSTCGGSVGDNIASAALLTFLPWIAIFGSVITVLIGFPGWKTAFSNVIGYFVVSGQANTILSDLLVDTDVSKYINDASQGDPTKRDALELAASAIVKLTGNMGLLINKMVPEDFMTYWTMLTPLMKEKYQNSGASDELQQKLLNLVVLRDNIGEAMWYVYTAVFLTSIVQYNIATQDCNPDLASLNINQQIFQQQQKTVKEENKEAQSTIYAH